jgi:hypothetical protein
MNSVIDNFVTALRRLPVGRRAAAALLASVVAFAAGGPVAARPKLLLVQQAGSAAELFPAQRGGVSLAQATAIAQSRFQGRIVRAETVSMGDRVVHEIRILGDDGRVRTVRIDAQTGSFL